MKRPLRWNFSSARAAFMKTAFDAVLQDLTAQGFASVIVQAAGNSVLHLHPTAPPDLTTLPQAAMTCQQFLKLKSGDLALVNDPSSGSYSLNTFTCVTVASLADGDVLIAARFQTPRKLALKVDEEGVRVPPMPIASRKNLNKDILAAMAMHPAAAPDLREKIENAAALLFEAARRLESLEGFNAQTFEYYLNDSSDAFESALAKLPLGAAVVSARLPGTGELIRLNLELTENHVQFDFKGTEPSAKAGVTDLVTLGTCIWSVLALIDQPVPFTSKVLGHFQVSTPTNSLLASRASVSLERGVSLIVPLIGELVHQALAKVNPTLKRAGTAGTDVLAQLEFAGNRTVSLSASPGTGAIATESGQDAFGPWTPFSQLDLERSESSAVHWTAAGIAKGTGGKGLKKGGDGELVACRVQEPAKLKWLIGRGAVRTEGQSGGRQGTPASIEIVRASGEKELFTDFEGVVDLVKGDEVRLHASGGGAWGELTETEKKPVDV